VCKQNDELSSVNGFRTKPLFSKHHFWGTLPLNLRRKETFMYIVTGAAGFIGSVIVEALNREKPNTPVVVCDWLDTDDRWKNIGKRVVHDVVAPEDLGNFLIQNEKEITAIIHMGADSSTTTTDMDAITQMNIRPTLDLFDWCARRNVPYIYASSAATYGDGTKGFEDNNDLSELLKLAPLNGYGYSKHMCDKAIVTRKSQPKQWVGLKFFNVYGPNEYHKERMQSVVAHSFRQIKENGKVELFKSYKEGFDHGGQSRDFIYVKDIANLIIWFLDNPKVSGIFNIGTGEARSFKDLALATFTALDKKPNIKYIEMPEDLQGKYQYYTEAGMGNLQSVYTKIMGKAYQFHSLEEGVTDYVQNHLDQADPYL
jgi:ADP-L-glycero-D-manno-heptose 6-epimerase